MTSAVEQFAPYRVLFVSLYCPLDELELREAGKSNRPGLARGQAEWVHRPDTYDLKLDTSQCRLEGCAEKILRALAERPSSTCAFSRLRQRFAAGEIQATFFRDDD